MITNRSLGSSISLQQNQILLGTQAFASPSDMPSSGVWENVILPKTPTFEGVYIPLLLHVMLRQGTSWYALDNIEYLLPPPCLEESEL